MKRVYISERLRCTTKQAKQALRIHEYIAGDHEPKYLKEVDIRTAKDICAGAELTLTKDLPDGYIEHKGSELWFFDANGIVNEVYFAHFAHQMLHMWAIDRDLHWTCAVVDDPEIAGGCYGKAFTINRDGVVITER